MVHPARTPEGEPMVDPDRMRELLALIERPCDGIDKEVRQDVLADFLREGGVEVRDGMAIDRSDPSAVQILPIKEKAARIVRLSLEKLQQRTSR